VQPFRNPNDFGFDVNKLASDLPKDDRLDLINRHSDEGQKQGELRDTVGASRVSEAYSGQSRHARLISGVGIRVAEAAPTR
jgi:hypothetical protein